MKRTHQTPVKAPNMTTLEKHQAPTSKLQRITNLQTAMRGLRKRGWCLEFGASLELGCWCLVLFCGSFTSCAAQDIPLAQAGETAARSAAAPTASNKGSTALTPTDRLASTT